MPVCVNVNLSSKNVTFYTMYVYRYKLKCAATNGCCSQILKISVWVRWQSEILIL